MTMLIVMYVALDFVIVLRDVVQMKCAVVFAGFLQ